MEYSSNNNNNKYSICKAQHFIHRDYSKRARARGHTHTHEHSDYSKLNLHSLKREANRDFRRMETATRNRKHGRSTVFGTEVFLGYIE